ncbi:MAG: hypothetical protein SFW35_00845 [Chitinophagales bacterium]|nr:hypothetical protein [Chitinophagales bacterium]
MKLAAIYNTFDGEELLEGSLKQIYPHCDEVIIVWQERSNIGQDHPLLSAFLLGLQSRYPKVCLLKYYPDLTLAAAYNELRKRTWGVERAKQLQCSHYLFIDNDEYYEPEAFALAKNRIAQQCFDATACRLYTYYHSPIYRLSPLENYWVPFICKIKEGQRFGQGFPVYADPTRGTLPVAHFYAFTEEELVMHHFSYVRKDIRAKLENSSARVNFKNLNDLVRRFESWKLGDEPINFRGFEIVETQTPETFGFSGKNVLHFQ